MNDKHKLLFIHIPKNAGTAIRAAMVGCRHLPQYYTAETANMVYRAYKEDFDLLNYSKGV